MTILLWRIRGWLLFCQCKFKTKSKTYMNGVNIYFLWVIYASCAIMPLYIYRSKKRDIMLHLPRTCASDKQSNTDKRFFQYILNASSVAAAATMATRCQIWRPERGRCFKVYGIVIVLFMDLIFQCVNGTFTVSFSNLCRLDSYVLDYSSLASNHCISIDVS